MHVKSIKKQKTQIIRLTVLNYITMIRILSIKALKQMLTRKTEIQGYSVDKISMTDLYTG